MELINMTEVWNPEIDKSKLSGDELLLQQAREDVKSGKMTTEEFREIWKEKSNHLKMTIDEYNALPNVGDNYEIGKLYRNDKDRFDTKVRDVEIGQVLPLLNVRSKEYSKFNIEIIICEII